MQKAQQDQQAGLESHQRAVVATASAVSQAKGIKAELEELSAFKKLSESEMLEQLIHQMFLKEMCDEKENSKY